MTKILFIHGLASSGTYKMATLLRQLMKPAEVIAPDVPIDPDEALNLLQSICDREKPDLVVGLSWGGFLALRLRSRAVAVVNPDLHISRIMRTMAGEVDYLSPRLDGATSFSITDALCDRYEELEKDSPVSDAQNRILGLFATEDELVRCGDEFESLFPGKAIKYPGKHLPTYPEVKKFIAPALLAYMEGNA